MPEIIFIELRVGSCEEDHKRSYVRLAGEDFMASGQLNQKEIVDALNAVVQRLSK